MLLYLVVLSGRDQVRGTKVMQEYKERERERGTFLFCLFKDWVVGGSGRVLLLISRSCFD